MLQLREWQKTVGNSSWALVPNYNKPRRSIVLAPPGAGKSTYAADKVRRCRMAGQRAIVAYTFSYLEDNFRSAMYKLGISSDDISTFSASSSNAFDADRPIQLISLQTADRRGFELLREHQYRVATLDECHTAFNFSAAVEMLNTLKIGHIEGLTGTYFQGSLTVDEKSRKHGAHIARAEPGCLFTAGTYEEMVEQKILRPIQYIRLDQKEVDHYALASCERAVDKFIELNSAKDCGWFFVSSARKGYESPIEMYARVLTSRGITPLVLDGNTTEAELEAAKAQVQPGKAAVFLSVDYGAVGTDHPPIHTVVLSTTHTGSPNTLYQKVGRGIREDGRMLPMTVIDNGCNFSLAPEMRGHPKLEDAVRSLVDQSDELYRPVYKGASVLQPIVTERSFRIKPASGDAFVTSLSPEAVNAFIKGGLPGVKRLYSTLQVDSPDPRSALEALLLEHGVKSPENWLKLV
jgi:superfamily II DNA or RNA helicase